MRTFTNPAVVAISATDFANISPIEGTAVVVHQDEYGPSYIVIGPAVTDDRLKAVAPKLEARYGATLDQLQRARAGERVEVRTAAPAMAT